MAGGGVKNRVVQGSEAKMGMRLKCCFYGLKIISPAKVTAHWKALFMEHSKMCLAWP